MKTLAVIAHTGKTFGGGLDELRRLIAGHGVEKLWWYEVPKSRKAPKKMRKALAHRPDLILVWGGDGMVQRCVDTVVGHDVPIAVLPAGTANLFAGNLGIPTDLPAAFDVATSGRRRRIDLGRMNGEHFAVMAGAGFDAEMIKRADGGAKKRLGRLAYIWAGARGLAEPVMTVTVKVDGTVWFRGDATCVLVGNVPKVFGSVAVFDDARPDDGLLDVGVATATNPVQLGHALLKVATGRTEDAPHIKVAQARRITIRSARRMRTEMVACGIGSGGSKSGWRPRR
ncbi:MAG TPA: diacylglycerol kinase family protein [Nakamurella sp.]